MSQGEIKPGEINELYKEPLKCRIPQRLPSRLSNTPKFISNSEQMSRPKIINRIKDDVTKQQQQQPPRRTDKNKFLLKRPSSLRRKSYNDNVAGTVKNVAKPVITVPIDKNYHLKHLGSRRPELPDQETIWNLEKETTSHSASHNSGDSGSLERVSESTLLANTWDQYMKQFEHMKHDLAERQKAVVKLYVDLQNTHHKMIMMGQKVTLPTSQDLNIMNVAKLPPDQLLRICTLTSEQGETLGKTPLDVDVRRLYGLPTKILATCEQTLIKRKEIIDWFVDLKSSEKGVHMYTLDKKLNEFTAENEMLQSTFEQARMDLMRELNDMVDFIRKTMNEAISSHLRTEELTCDISDLTSQNNDLRKRLQHNETLRPNKAKIEELEKELKEERNRKSTMKERLTRAEGQLKMGTDRASQLESALEQSRSKVWSLERTINQLNKQNEKLQCDFEKELNSLTTSIRENMANLEEIGIARDTLQTEKEELEKRLEQQSASYNESLESVKAVINVNLAKLTETEKKYQDETKEREALIKKLETVTVQANELECKNKDLQKQLQEYQDKVVNYENELKAIKVNLEMKMNDFEEYKTRCAKQSETIRLLESDLVVSFQQQEGLKSSINEKDKYIIELENKQKQQAKQLEESEDKMSSYEEQLSGLKNHINQLKEDFGEFENLDEIHSIVNEQREKLSEAMTQNDDLVKTLHKKDFELHEQIENRLNLEKQLEKKDCDLKKMSEKDEEQSNIIKLLRNNLAMRTQADEDLTQQIMEKKTEITSLISNLETRKQQICQLEKIILALEEETRISGLQRRKDQDRISFLEKQVNENEILLSEYKREVPATNLDSIINILEQELSTAFDPHISTKSHQYFPPEYKYMGDIQHYEPHPGENNEQAMYQPDHEPVSTKIVMGNKKTFISNSNNELFKRDLGRKEAITNIIPQSPGNIKYVTPIKDKENYGGHIFTDLRHKDNSFLVCNKFRFLPFLNSTSMNDEKKRKMFKLAGHRI